MSKPSDPCNKPFSNVQYEWCIETMGGENNEEVVDAHHEDKLKDLCKRAREGQFSLDENERLVLIRTDYSHGGSRAWAYITDDGKLPLAFTDALDNETSIVPKRFHKEFLNL